MNSLISMILANNDNKQQYYDMAGSCSTTAFLYYCNRNMSFTVIFDCLLKSQKIAFASYLVEKFVFVPTKTNYNNVIRSADKNFINKFFAKYNKFCTDDNNDLTELLSETLKVGNYELYIFLIKNYKLDPEEDGWIISDALEGGNEQIIADICKRYRPEIYDANGLFFDASQTHNEKIINIITDHYAELLDDMDINALAGCGRLSLLKERYQEEPESFTDSELWQVAIEGEQLQVCKFLYEIEYPFINAYFLNCVKYSTVEIYQWLQAHFPCVANKSFIEGAISSNNKEMIEYFFAQNLIPSREYMIKNIDQKGKITIILKKYFAHYFNNKIPLCARCGNFATALSEYEANTLVRFMLRNLKNLSYILSFFVIEERVNCAHCHKKIRGANTKAEWEIYEFQVVLEDYIRKHHMPQESILARICQDFSNKMVKYQNIGKKSGTFLTQKRLYYGKLIMKRKNNKYYINDKKNEKILIGNFSIGELYRYYQREKTTICDAKGNKFILIDYDEYCQGFESDDLIAQAIHQQKFFGNNKKFIKLDYHHFYNSKQNNKYLLSYCIDQDYFFYDKYQKKFILGDYNRYFEFCDKNNINIF